MSAYRFTPQALADLSRHLGLHCKGQFRSCRPHWTSRLPSLRTYCHVASGGKHSPRFNRSSRSLLVATTVYELPHHLRSGKNAR